MKTETINKGTMGGMNIELMRLLSERLNIGKTKPNFSLRVKRKDKKGGFEAFPFEIPNVISISLDRRYNMTVDELKVTVYDKNGTLSPDYSPAKEYRNAENLPKSGFKDVLVPFNRVELDIGYAEEIRRVFTGQITGVAINEGMQTIEITCKNMFRRLQKPIDPKGKKALLYENAPAGEILKDLFELSGLTADGYLIKSSTIENNEFTINKAEFPLGMYYSDAIQSLLDVMGHRVYADEEGCIKVEELKLYSQKNFHVWEIDDYVNMTSGEYNMDSSFVRNRVIIQASGGWKAFEDPFLLKFANGERIACAVELPWAETEKEMWAAADKLFLDMRRKLRRITVSTKGNPSLKIGDLIKMTGLISTMTEKYMVIGIQTTYSSSGYIDVIDLEHANLTEGHLCNPAEGGYEDVEGSISGEGLVPVMTTKRRQILDYALSWEGTLYQWGGDCAHNPGHYGFDCSHFVWTVYEKFGLMNKYMVSKDIYKSFCIPIEEKDLKAGDLVFYSNDEQPENIRHVGIYAEGGTVISAMGNSEITSIGEARKRKKAVVHHPIGWDSGYRIYGRVKGL